MIFSNTANAEILAAEETRDHLKVLHGQEIGPHLKMCHWLREHDETQGWTKDRAGKHLASLPEITLMIILNERPEMFSDGREWDKWLKTDVGKQYRVSREANPIKGDGLQVIFR